MHPFHSSSRRRPKAKTLLGPEALESRSLLTGGAGNTFAMIPVTIEEAGGTADVEFTISQPPFRLPRDKMVIGVDAIPQAGSGLNPLVSQIANPHGDTVPQAIHTIYNPHLPREAVAAGAGTGAVLAPIVLYPRQPDRPATYTATISGENKTSGDALVGFYLPGDADGNGVVDRTDLGLVRGVLHSVAGDGRYNFNADANRDGRIGSIDLAYTIQNLGVATTVLPDITAMLDPASDTGAPDLITDLSPVRLTGTATPGAALKFEALGSSLTPVETTAGADGRFVVDLPLASGINRYQVTAEDSFGQTIVRQVQPIVFSRFARGVRPAMLSWGATS